MALGETQIVAETREFLMENGIVLDSFSQVLVGRRDQFKNFYFNSTIRILEMKVMLSGFLFLLPQNRPQDQGAKQ